MKRLAVLISNKGTGTNLQAIINATKTGKVNGKIVSVISDTQEALGLERARKHNLAIKICPKKEDLLPMLQKLKPNYICLAGWKQIVADNVIGAYPEKILNLHPGLIPGSLNGIVKNSDGTKALWNRGLLAKKAVLNFINQKATYAGSSIHFLTHEFDFGPVLARGFVKIKKTDTVQSLYDRLKKVEHRIYIESLQKLCNSK